jgi:hypothetical protein
MKAVVLALFPLVLAAPDAAEEPPTTNIALPGRHQAEHRAQLIEVELTHAATTYRLLEGPGLVIEHAGEKLRLARNGAGRAELVHEPVPSVVVAAVGAEEALM